MIRIGDTADVSHVHIPNTYKCLLQARFRIRFHSFFLLLMIDTSRMAEQYYLEEDGLERLRCTRVLFIYLFINEIIATAIMH